MVAFEAAVRLGYRYVETDVHATADGVLVAFHDEHLDRVTDQTGVIAGLPWSQVARARVGGTEPVPTLVELLDAWPGLRVNVDIKADSAIAPLVAAVERTRAHDRVCVTSFSDSRRRQAVARLSAPVATSGGTRTVGAFLAAQRLPGRLGRAAVRRALAGVHALQVPERHGRVPVVTAATVAAAHEAGVPVHVWTIDEPGDMHRLLDLGVDGLVTDRSDLLRDVLVERGVWSEA